MMFEETTSAGDNMLFAAFALPLVAAAVWDAWKFRIPNLLPLLLVIAFVPAGLLSPAPIDWLWHVAVGVAVLVAGAVLFAQGWAGGGDVKLAAACALWAGPMLPTYLILMALLGSVVALIILLLRHGVFGLQIYLPKLQGLALPRILMRGEGLPYGIAIAGAGLVLAPSLPFFGG